MRLLSGLSAAILAFSELAFSQSPHFDPKTLADDLTGGYQVVVCDVNADGHPDIIALASGMKDLVWFEGPNWRRHVLATNMSRMINAACWNPSPRQLPVIAVAYEFSNSAAQSAGLVATLTPPADPLLPWSVTVIDRLPTSHRLRWADIDGSGRKVLVNAPLTAATAAPPDYSGRVPLVYYRPGEWKRQLISEGEQGLVHGIFITDWDHDSSDDILIGGFSGIHLYKFFSNGDWSRTGLAKGNPEPSPKSGTSDVTVGFLGRERFLAAIEPWHGNQVVEYRQRAGLWERNLIDDTLLDAHNIAAADFNGDGNYEIVAGYRGKPYGVNIYRYQNRRWFPQVLERGTQSASGCAVHDLDEDGRLDIVCIGAATHNLVLYRNTSPIVPSKAN